MDILCFHLDYLIQTPYIKPAEIPQTIPIICSTVPLIKKTKEALD